MTYDLFVDNLIRILEKNSYPEKKVALPLERLYEAAYEKKLNFNKVLEVLHTRGIGHDKTTQKVIFFPVNSAQERSDRGEAPKDLSAMMSQAMDMLRQMTPEQRDELEKMVLNMNDEEKAQMKQKARDMGLGL